MYSTIENLHARYLSEWLSIGIRIAENLFSKIENFNNIALTLIYRTLTERNKLLLKVFPEAPNI